MEKEQTNNESKLRKFLFNQVSLGIALVSVVISSFVFITAPSGENSVALQLQEQRIVAQRETIDSITKTQQNDTQEVKRALEALVIQLQLQGNEIIKLTTIIEERIPRDNNK